MSMHEVKKRLRVLKRPYQATVDVFNIIGCIAYDGYRYLRWSSAVRHRSSKGTTDVLLTKYYHMIEKGLALPQPRPGFGAYPIGRLFELLDGGIKTSSVSREGMFALEALAAYRDFHGAADLSDEHGVGAFVDAAESALSVGVQATATIPAAWAADEFFRDRDPLAFFSSRHSVRQFTSRAVGQDELERAVEIAQTSPSVCNRQAGHVHLVSDRELRESLLALQDGNRGFGSDAPVLAVITCEIDHFVLPQERYQMWIDGGLFAMSFILGLHAAGLSTCCLNWSALPKNDKLVRGVLPLKPEESIIMFIAVGWAADDLRVARSPRKLTSQVMTMHGSEQ